MKRNKNPLNKKTKERAPSPGSEPPNQNSFNPSQAEGDVETINEALHHLEEDSQLSPELSKNREDRALKKAS